jgi:formylglycine-generating enzyme required for sulfatase activity
MPWPTPTDYRHAIQDSRGALDDEELRHGEVSRDARGLPILWSGNFASVYRVHCPATGKTWALKCFTREVSTRQERYQHIAAGLEAARLPFTVPFVYLERGIRIHGRWHPAVKMEWVEGQTLNRFVENSLDKPKMLQQLLELWPKLAGRLRDAEIAHADLQHGNVLLVPAPDGKLALKLIDYDGMYVPALAGTRSGEAGHPNYQHPRRLLEGAYNVHVDRFSHLAIFSAVHALHGGNGDLWKRFNNDENLLFREQDFQAPEQSQLFRVLWETDDPSVRGLVGRLALACRQPPEEVPWLDQIVQGGQVEALAYAEQQAVASLMAAGKAATRSKAPASGAATASATEFPIVNPDQVAPSDTRPILAKETVPESPPPGGDFRAAGKWRLASFATVARCLDGLFRRLVGEENDLLRYFLWAALPLLLLLAVWAGIWALTPSPVPPVPWKLGPIAPQTVEMGKPLSVTATVENSAAWEGKLRYSLGPQSPPGATINAQTGELTWTPTPDQARAKYDVTVSAETPDGRHDETTLMVAVTVPVPLKLKPIAPQTVEVEKPLSVAVALENAEVWKGKVRYGLNSPALLGMSIDAATGIFTWTPTGQAADERKVTVSATGPDGRRDETSFVVNVLRPIPPLRLQPISSQTVEAGKPLRVTATVENAAAWQRKLRHSLGPQSPAGATINAQTGELTWTPSQDQAVGKYDLTVSAQGPDGQTAKTTFVVTVTRPLKKKIAVDLGGGVKLEMVLIPAGEFLMGSPDSDKNVQVNEKPQHRVRITKPLYLGKYLVTQEQWEAVMGSNPSNFKGPKNPVGQVSWEDCRGFVEKLNAKIGGGKFSLPTEAQWEYACRAGSTTRYCFGDEESGLSEYAWYGANSDGRTHPVGEKNPNAWRLYDMHGNVWEWCQDWYDGRYNANSSTDDPTGPSGGSGRVNRGGGWCDTAALCRSAIRDGNSPGRRDDSLGLRVSRVAADETRGVPLALPVLQAD